MRKLTFLLACLALGASHVSAQSMTSRVSRWNYNYVFGAGPDVHTGNDEEIETAIIPLDTQSTGYTGATSGVLPGPIPYSAGVDVTIANRFEFSGSPTQFTQLFASGQTAVSAVISGGGSASIFASNPGNNVSTNFQLDRARKFQFTGSIVCPTRNNPGEVRLQRFDGFAWQYIATTLFLPQSQGTVNASGVLYPGQYRTSAGTSITAVNGSFATCDYSMALEFLPSTVTISGTVNLGDFIGTVAGETIKFEIRSFNGTVVLDTIPNVPLDASGNYSFTTAVTGTGLRVCARGRTWVKECMLGINLTENQTTTVNFNCTNGDADRSGEVDAADIDLIIANFGESVGSPTYNIDADLDGSTEVDAADIDVAIANFGAADD